MGWQVGVRRGRALVACLTAVCGMQQILPDLISQVATGPSADPAAVAVAKGTAGTTASPSSPAAAADEPPDAHQQAAQCEQRAQHCTDDHAYTPGVCKGKERPVRLLKPGRCLANQEVPGQSICGKGRLRALGQPVGKTWGDAS